MDDLEQRAMAAMRDGADVQVTFQPVELLAWIGAVQLALRHPEFPATTAGLLRKQIGAIVRDLPPGLAEVVALGWSHEADGFPDVDLS